MSASEDRIEAAADWSDEEWLERIRTTVAEEPSPSAEAVAIVGAWNAVREAAQGLKVATMMTAAPCRPYAIERQLIHLTAVRCQEDPSANDVVLIAVPPGAGRAVREAVHRALGIRP